MVVHGSNSRIQSLETTFAIVRCLHDREMATIEEIAAEIDSSTSTVHRHLVTLRELGYVVVTDGNYQLSLLFLTHGGKTRERLFGSKMLDQKVRQLAERTAERAQFMIEENGERVYVYTHSAPSGVKTDTNVGKRGPLHISAGGKAILANLPEERTASILDDVSFEAVTERTITDRESIAIELEKIRERGYAFNDEESTERLRAVGVPIYTHDEAVFGAISVSGPAHRFRDTYFTDELPELLLGTANEIELNLRYP